MNKMFYDYLNECKYNHFTDDSSDFDYDECILVDYDEDLPPDRNRNHTKTSIFLVHKWIYEGMPVNMVAKILNRSEENVFKALRSPLNNNELLILRRYFSPFKKKGRKNF